MADVILDAIFEVVQIALMQNNFLNHVGLKKDYTNFSLILQLKNWTNTIIGEEVDLNCEKNVNESFHDYNDGDFLAEPVTGTTVKIENCVNEDDLKKSCDSIHTSEGNEQKMECSVPLVRVDVKNNLEGYQIEHIKSESQSNKTPTQKNENKYSLTKRSISTKKSKKKTKNGNASINLNGRFELTSKYLEHLSKRKKGVTVKKKYIKKYNKNKNCQLCDYKTDSLPKLQRHLTTHSSEKPLACSLCDFRCKRDDSFRNHLRIHTGEKPFKCDQCELAFSTTANRLNHKKYWHNDVKTESCKYCDYTAKLRCMVRAHEKRMHLQQTTLYKCQQCGTKTYDETRYKKHMRAHELNISFACFCGKSFTNQNELKVHRKRAHESEGRKKTISCPNCESKFSSNTALKVHSIVHTGVKAFDCRLCDLSYSHMKSLQKHRNIKHSNEPLFHCVPCNSYTDSLRERKKHFSSAMHLENVPNTIADDSENNKIAETSASLE